MKSWINRCGLASLLDVILPTCRGPMPLPTAAKETSGVPSAAEPPETQTAAPTEITPSTAPEAAPASEENSAENAAAKPEYEKAVAALRAGQDAEAEALFKQLTQRS